MKSNLTKIHRITALVLCFLMVMSNFPAAVFAEGDVCQVCSEAGCVQHCPVCGNENCATDHSSEPVETTGVPTEMPESRTAEHPLVNKKATFNSTFVNLYEHPTNWQYNMVVATALPKTVVITEVYSDEFYRIDAAEGETWPADYSTQHYVKSSSLTLIAEEPEIPTETQPVTVPSVSHESGIVISSDAGIPTGSKVEATTIANGYDIKILDAEGNEWQPIKEGKTVTISLPVANVPDGGYVDVYHFIDCKEDINGDEEILDTTGASAEELALLAPALEAYGDGTHVAVEVTKRLLVSSGKVNVETDSFSLFTETQVPPTEVTTYNIDSLAGTTVYVRPGEWFRMTSNWHLGSYWSRNPTTYAEILDGGSLSFINNADIYVHIYDNEDYAGNSFTLSLSSLSGTSTITIYIVEDFSWGDVNICLLPEVTSSYSGASDNYTGQEGFLFYTDNGINTSKISYTSIPETLINEENIEVYGRYNEAETVFGIFDATAADEYVTEDFNNLKSDIVSAFCERKAIAPERYEYYELDVLAVKYEAVGDNDGWYIICKVNMTEDYQITFVPNYPDTRFDEFSFTKDSGVMPVSQTVATNGNTTVTTNLLTNSGMKMAEASNDGTGTDTANFVCWSTDPIANYADAEGKQGIAGDSWYFPGEAITLSGDIELYAVWKTSFTYDIANIRYICRVTDENGDLLDTDQEFSFTADSKLSGRTYQKYSGGAAVGEPAVFAADNLTFTLRSREYIRIEDVAIAESPYVFTSVAPTGFTGAATQTVTLNNTSGSFSSIHIFTCEAHEITYKANGGAGTDVEEKVNHGYSYTIAANTFTHATAGYIFNGWNTSADGSGTAYAPGNVVTVSDDMTLYAQWRPAELTVKFDKNASDATGLMEDQVFLYGVDDAITTNAFARANHVFKGWSLDPNATTAQYEDEMTYTYPGYVDDAVTLYAVWTPVYTVKFNIDGATVKTETVEHGKPATAPNIPAKEGYTQVAPYWDKVYNNVTTDLTVTAVYTINKYTVDFVIDGETVKTESVAHGGAATAPQIPSKVGYTQTAPYWDVAFDEVTTNLTVTAVYTINKYTVTYMAGTQTVHTEKVAHGDNVANVPEVPAKTGYTGVWESAGQGITDVTTINAVYTPNDISYTIETYTMGTDGKYGAPSVQTLSGKMDTTVSVAPVKQTGLTVDESQSVLSATINENGATLKIYYSRDQHTITFDTDGGNAITQIKGYYDAAVEAPADPEKVGHSFAGWDKPIPDKIPAEDITIKAKWKVNQYTINFNTDGGSAVAAITADYGTTVNAPAAPTKNGYTFAGWLDEAGNAAAVPATMPANTVNLKAKWNINTYTVTFDTDGGNSQSALTYTITSDKTLPITVEKRGYTFIGWQAVEAEGSWKLNEIYYGDSTKGMYGNAKLKALWQTNTYTVRFNGNNATAGEMADMAFVYDVEGKLNTNQFSRTGYTFAGWAESANGAVKYTDGQLVENLTDTNGTTVVLYAVWNPISYTIELNSNGVLSTSIVIPATYDEAVELPANSYTKTGYTFAGWARTGDGAKAYNDKATVLNLADTNGAKVVLYAVWQKNTYQVTYNTNGGVEIPQANVLYGDVVPLPVPDWDVSKHQFIGWQYAGRIVTAEDATRLTMPAENIELTAVWKHSYAVKHSYENLNGTDTVHTETFWGAAGDKTTANAQMKDGYKLAKAVEQVEITADGNAVVEIRYELIRSGVTFQVTGNAPASFTKPADLTDVGYGETITIPVVTAVEGYTFDGWYVNGQAVTGSIIMPDSAVTVTGSWSIHTHAVNYKFQFESGSYDQNTLPAEYARNYNYGEEVTLNAPAALTGYDFIGWYNEGKKIDALKVPDQDVTLVGVYAEQTFTITYDPVRDAAGSEFERTKRYFTDHTVAAALADIPAADGGSGISFVEWNTSADGSGVSYKPGDQITGNQNITLFAIWNPPARSVTVHFEPAGIKASNAIEVSAEKQITLDSGAYPITGYHFKNWSDVVYQTNGVDNKVDSTVQQGKLTFTMPLWDVVVTANYEANGDAGYVVHHIEKGVAQTPENAFATTASNYDLVYGNSYRVDAVPQEGFTPEKNPPYVMVNAGYDPDNVYWFVYTRNRHTVSYSADAGITVPASGEHLFEDVVTVSDIPVRDGYTFTGWKDNDTNEVYLPQPGEQVTFTMPDRNVVLLATWEANTYAVTYGLSQIKPGHVQVPVATTAKTDETVTLPTVEVPAGYQFSWSSQPAVTITDGKFTMPAGPVHFTGTYTYVPYSVNLEGLDGAQITGDPSEYNVGSAVVLPTPTKTNYVFLGWEDASGKLIDNTAENPAIPVGSIGDKTFTAKWRVATGELNVTIQVTADQSHVIHVFGQDVEGKRISFRVPVVDGSVQIKGLPYGEYTLRDDSQWSWRCEELEERTVSHYSGVQNVEISFTKDNTRWLSGIDHQTFEIWSDKD